MLKPLAILLLLSITGCDILADPKPFSTPPQAGQVCLAVDWMKAQESCEGENVNGCARGLSGVWWALTIPKPTGWGDLRAMETTGHELMHALSARHD